MNEADSKVIIFILFVVTYMAIRHFIYASVPIAGTFDDWVVRDTIMNLPRVGLIALVVIYGLRTFGRDRMGFNRNGARIALIFFMAEIAVLVADGCMRDRYKLPLRQIIFLSVNSLIVAFSEEILFRGLGVCALLAWKGVRFALWGSTVVFVLFHLEAQPFMEWPGIFCFGLLMCQMRLLGVSIIWLILSHAAFDSSWYVLDGTGGPSFRWLVYGSCSALLPATFYIYQISVGWKLESTTQTDPP